MDASANQSENRYIADQLAEVAELLQQQNASSFRINAYRSAADYVSQSANPVRETFNAAGLKGLEDLPTIGATIAQAIAGILETGTLSMLDRLRGAMDPEKLFQTLPNIGPHLANLIHSELHIETLEALETAALNGRLGALKGIGPRRVRGIQHALASILARRRPQRAADQKPMPPMATLLSVDQQYRRKADQDQLATIIPRRFNLSGKARIPILHTEQDAWRFTALFSNSLNAHRFGHTRDWVILFFEQDGHAEGQCTVVTEHKGILAGKRVVRGHEKECLRHYECEAEKPSTA